MANESVVNWMPLVKREFVNNSAAKFFSDYKINSTEINLGDPRQVAFLISKNIKKISITLLNEYHENPYIIVHLRPINLLAKYNINDFGPESIKILEDNLRYALNSIDELCQSIRLNQQDAVQVFESIGITYEHGNLPESCDGLFIHKLQTYEEYTNSTDNNVDKNFAFKFFLELGIDTARVNLSTPLQLTKFIKVNDKEVAKAYFNNALKMHNLYISEVKNGQIKEIKKIFSNEPMRLINNLYNEVKNSVDEICQSIKLNQQDAVQVFKSIGITYEHGNLPASCDGLFYSKMQEAQDYASSSGKKTVPIPNIASKFFSNLNIDTSKISLETPFQITKFIKDNQKEISKAIFNHADELNKMHELEPPTEIFNFFGGEAIRLLNDQYQEVKDSVAALCKSIKANEQDAIQIFELVGIDHTITNLPEECKGLF